MNDFLPVNDSEPIKYSNYTKLEEGENTIRVLGSAIVGFEWWEDQLALDGSKKRYPSRVKTYEELTPDKVDEARYFWAFAVWNYKANKIQIMEITQSTIRKGIKALINNPKWGDPKEYDLVITKVRSGPEPRDVDYNVQPNPKEALPEEITTKHKDSFINLEALYSGSDPFEEPGGEDFNAKVEAGLKKGKVDITSMPLD